MNLTPQVDLAYFMKNFHAKQKIILKKLIPQNNNTVSFPKITKK